MTTHLEHPIGLIETYFIRSIVIANPSYRGGSDRAAAAPKNDVQVVDVGEDRPGFYLGTMHTVVNLDMDPSAPYVIDMECVGVFKANSTLTETEARRGILITANSVLYGAIREAVSALTGRQPHGALTLGLSVLQPTSELPNQDVQAKPSGRRQKKA